MSLSSPTKIVFLISLIAAILASIVLFTTISIPVVGGYATYLLVGAYILLAAGCVLKGV